MNNVFQTAQPVSCEQKDLLRRLELLLCTGELLMASAADTARVMRTMERVAAFLNLAEEKLQIYINYNMLMVNWSDGDSVLTKFKRVKKHGIDMTAISQVSDLTCRATDERMSLTEFEEELAAIRQQERHYTPWQVALGAGLACGGFCMQFGGDWTAFLYSSIAAAIGLRLRMFIASKPGANHYVSIVVVAFVSTLLAWLFAFVSSTSALSPFLPRLFHSSTPWHPLMACALFIVPGVPLINFVSDMLSGHVHIGFTRAMNTLLMVVSMVFGIAFAVQVCGIDNFVRDLSMVPHHDYMTYAIAAAISAMGFSMIFNIPPRLLWVVALGGVIAVCCRNFVNLGESNGNVGLDMGLTIGSLAGSALISVLLTRIVHWVHAPHHCLSIPSVIPMIPGVLMYRALFAFIDMQGNAAEVAIGMNYLIKASLVIFCIALGVAIPNVFMRRLIPAKQPNSDAFIGKLLDFKRFVLNVGKTLLVHKIIILKFKKLDKVFQNFL